MFSASLYKHCPSYFPHPLMLWPGFLIFHSWGSVGIPASISHRPPSASRGGRHPNPSLLQILSAKQHQFLFPPPSEPFARWPVICSHPSTATFKPHYAVSRISDSSLIIHSGVLLIFSPISHRPSSASRVGSRHPNPSLPSDPLCQAASLPSPSFRAFCSMARHMLPPIYGHV